MEVNQLVAITDVTLAWRRPRAACPPRSYADARKAVTAAIEKECATSDDSAARSSVCTAAAATTYTATAASRTSASSSRRRIAIAFFGGDPDNFNFPRYDLDVSFIRIYGHDGRPMAIDHHLAWSDRRRSAKATSPSSRVTPVAPRVRDPGAARRRARLRAAAPIMTWPRRCAAACSSTSIAAASSAAIRRQLCSAYENWLKAMKGPPRRAGRRDLPRALAKAEARSCAHAVAARSRTRRGLRPRLGRHRGHRQARQEVAHGIRSAGETAPESELFRHRPRRCCARRRDRQAEWRTPEGIRRCAAAPAEAGPAGRAARLSKNSRSPAGLVADTMREDLGADHPVIKSVFGRRSPAEIATTAVTGSRLRDS